MRASFGQGLLTAPFLPVLFLTSSGIWGLSWMGGGVGGQVCLKDSAWSLRKIRTAAMGRSEMWIEGHLRLRASGGPTGLATSGVGWRTQGFSLL